MQPINLILILLSYSLYVQYIWPPAILLLTFKSSFLTHYPWPLNPDRWPCLQSDSCCIYCTLHSWPLYLWPLKTATLGSQAISPPLKIHQFIPPAPSLHQPQPWSSSSFLWWPSSAAPAPWPCSLAMSLLMVLARATSFLAAMAFSMAMALSRTPASSMALATA